MKTLILVSVIYGYLSFIPLVYNSVQDRMINKAETFFFDFENYNPGNLPSGWEQVITGKGDKCNWKVTKDKNNKILAQLSSSSKGNRFNVIVNNNVNIKDISIEVRFKAIKGDEDQGGGPVWRYQNKNNYYVARTNPLENNYRVYKVIDGIRIELQSADVDLQKGKWYTMKIVMIGDKIECSLNGKKELSIEDNSIPQSGKCGLWTKADAITYFDDMSIKTH